MREEPVGAPLAGQVQKQHRGLEARGVDPAREGHADADAFGVALNPMVESEWMLSRNGCILIVMTILIMIMVMNSLLSGLPQAQKSKLGQTKKLTPGKCSRDPKNIKIQGRCPSVHQISRPKVQFEITPKYTKNGGGAHEIFFVL